MFPLLFSFALTLAGMDAAAQMYEPSERVDPGVLYLQQFEMRLSSRPFFIGGEVQVFDWKVADELSWWPNRLGSKVSAGLDFGWLEMGWEHYCTHPVTPGRSFKATPPKWEGWSDMIYFRVKGRVELLR